MFPTETTILAALLFLAPFFGGNVCLASRDIVRPDILWHGQPEIPEPAAQRSKPSVSKTQTGAYYHIRVLGTGEHCLVLEYTVDKTADVEHGSYASTDADLEFYGEVECEAGDVGFAAGMISADVVAFAYEKGGETCVSRVVASVCEDPLVFAVGDVDVDASAYAAGQAESLC